MLVGSSALDPIGRGPSAPSLGRQAGMSELRNFTGVESFEAFDVVVGCLDNGALVICRVGPVVGVRCVRGCAYKRSWTVLTAFLDFPAGANLF